LSDDGGARGSSHRLGRVYDLNLDPLSDFSETEPRSETSQANLQATTDSPDSESMDSVLDLESVEGNWETLDEMHL